MKIDLMSKYILAIVGIVALVGIVVMIMNTAGSFSTTDISGQATAAMRTATTTKTTDARVSTTSTAKTATKTSTATKASTVADVSISVPSNPLAGGAFVEAEFEGIENGIVDLQATYSVPGNFFGGSAMDMREYMIDIQVVNVDTIMQDWNSFVSASMGGLDGDGYSHHAEYNDMDGNHYYVAWNEDSTGRAKGYSSITDSNGGTETTPWENDGFDESTSDGPGKEEKDEEEDEEDKEDKESEDDESGDNSIVWESEGGMYIIMELMDQIMNEIGTMENTELLLQGVETTRMKNQYINTLTVNINENLAGMTYDFSGVGSSYEVRIVDIRVE